MLSLFSSSQEIKCYKILQIIENKQISENKVLWKREHVKCEESISKCRQYTMKDSIL